MSATVGRGELKYTPSHLWVRVEDGEAVIGLTGFGQERHGKVNYIGLPAVGAPVTYGMLCQELFGCRHDDASHEPIDKGACPGLCSMLNLEPVSESYEVTNASGQPTRVAAQYTPIARPGEPRRAIVTLTVLD